MATYLITGASRGIGAEIAVEAAALGHRVVINYNKSEAAALTLAEKLGGCAMAYRADVSDEMQVKAMFNAVADTFGGVDVLINNAGVSSFGVLQDITAAEWDRVFAVNVKGAFLCAREAIPQMLGKKDGCIINISSMWGIAGSSCEVHYSASKAALIGMTKALAKELGPSGIRVNCVAPGVIDTDMNKALTADAFEALREETPLGRIGSTCDIAKCVMFLVGDGAKFITGQTISPNGGLVI